VNTVERIAEIRAVVRGWRGEGARVGLVPTMGSLHAGHMSLLAAAKFRADRLIASVFVNPLQFGPNEDFERYPRSPTEDSALLAEAGCDVLFLPAVEEIYPGGRDSATRVTVQPLCEILEGAHRPGHFEGVATVVAKLFGIVQPDVAVFGEKDFQQLAVIRRMTLDLNIPVEIIPAPTVRSPDGLAMSSRNRYLSPAERALAPQIHAALKSAAAQIASGQRDYAGISAAAIQALSDASMRPDYFEIRDADTLLPPTVGVRELVILVAARLGKARLIDNLRVSLR
jgi:pantoate--beta-alanine ligase